MQSHRPKSKITNRKSPIPPELSPVQIKGQSHQLYVLQKLLAHKRGKPKPTKLSGLGDILVPWFEKSVRKPGESLEGIGDIWEQLAPKRIADHARLAGFQRGTLLVTLDHATARSELESLLRQGLLRQLQTASKGAVFKVKTSIDGSTTKHVF